MNKITWFLCLSILVSVGCEKNTDEPTGSDEGKILGKWEGYDRTLVNKDGSLTTLPAGCGGYMLDFFEDGTVRWVDFVPVEGTTDNCQEDQSTDPIGRWERISNGKYRFILKNVDNGSETVIIPESVTFFDKGAIVMTINYSTSDLPSEAGPNAEYYYLTLFKR